MNRLNSVRCANLEEGLMIHRLDKGSVSPDVWCPEGLWLQGTYHDTVAGSTTWEREINLEEEEGEEREEECF